MVAASNWKYSHEDVPALRESARILEGTRLAGSYKRFFLAPHHGMLALRALVLRGRAKARASPYYHYCQTKVLNFYTTEGTGDEGCNIHFVASSLAMDLDQVKDIIESLCSEGYLYSTSDDDHHKAVSDVESWPLLADPFFSTSPPLRPMQTVLNFYETEGCNSNFVASSLPMHLNQVDHIIQFLSCEVEILPIRLAVVPSFLLPDPVFFLILEFWLGAY